VDLAQAKVVRLQASQGVLDLGDYPVPSISPVVGIIAYRQMRPLLPDRACTLLARFTKLGFPPDYTASQREGWSWLRHWPRSSSTTS
jgi:hypothetical protein